MWQIIDRYLGILIMAIIFFAFAKIVLQKKTKLTKIKLILCILIFSILYAIIYFNFSGTLKTAIIFSLNFLFFKYVFDLTIPKAIFLTFVYIVLLMIPDAIELVAATKIFGMETEYYYNEFAGTFLCSLIVGILFIIMTLIFRKPLNKLMNINIENEKLLIIYMILTFICVAVFFYNAFSNIELKTEITGSIMIIIIFLIILFSLIKQTIDNNKLTREYDKLLEFMTTYENEIENQRILRHEIKNEFRTIRAKICDNQENKEIIEYIDEIVNDKYEIKKEEYAKFGYLPPNGIKGLCYFKTQEAENKGIKVSLNVSKRIKESTIYKLNVKQQRDFGRVLGVILDNAIEASEESKEKQLGIEAYTNSEKEFKIIVTNTYNNEIDKTKIGKETFSTKGKTRGHGLLLVKQIEEKNEIFEMDTEIREEIYIQTIKIKNIDE